MVATTQYGTGRLAFAKTPYIAAGKTGTAQVYTVSQTSKYNAKTVSDKLRDHAWFIAFAPAENPRIAMAVLVENSGFGSQERRPIARKVIDTYLLDQDGNVKTSAPPPPGRRPNTFPNPHPRLTRRARRDANHGQKRSATITPVS